jgi:hypothetical protein
MPFSAKRPAYSDNPSEASHCVIVATGFPLAAVQRGEDTSKPHHLEGNTPNARIAMQLLSNNENGCASVTGDLFDRVETVPSEVPLENRPS